MIIEAIIGLVLGLLINKINEYTNFEPLMQVVVLIISILILAFLSLIGWTFLVCFVIGVFLYTEYIASRW